MPSFDSWKVPLMPDIRMGQHRFYSSGTSMGKQATHPITFDPPLKGTPTVLAFLSGFDIDNQVHAPENHKLPIKTGLKITITDQSPKGFRVTLHNVYGPDIWDASISWIALVGPVEEDK